MSATSQIGLILGQQISPEVQFITHEIERQGHIAIVIDSRDISHNISIEYYATKASLLLNIRGHKVSMSQISGVYWSSVDTPKALQHSRPDAELSSAHILDDLVTEPNMDLACLMQLLFAQTHINWLNAFTAIQFHRIKPKQLSLAHSLGAHIPATYIGNCPHSIQAFLAQHPDSIIKPVFAGGHTKRLPPDLSTYKEICKWARYPVTLQEYVPGDNIRTYIVGNFIISAKIDEICLDDGQTQTPPSLVSDYREAENVKLIRYELPIETQQLAIRIMRAFHLQYTAIDWRVNAEGEFFFLEANPAPLFVNAQQQLGIEIDRAIVDLMFA